MGTFCCCTSEQTPTRYKSDIDMNLHFSTFFVGQNMKKIWKEKLGKGQKFANKAEAKDISILSLSKSNRNFDETHFNNFRFEEIFEEAMRELSKKDPQK